MNQLRFKLDFLSYLKKSVENKKVPKKVSIIFKQLYETYAQSITASGMQMARFDHLFFTFLERVEMQIAQPFVFNPFHERITHPFDYYRFGIEFIRPLVDKEKSLLLYKPNIDAIVRQLKSNENVILLANHQTEVDPQLTSIILEDSHPMLASDMIFVAGDRVVTDPMAVPFSMGRNLLCIYSKRHIANPPEKRIEKQLHNQKTMNLLCHILVQGGKCIYVAPSGGRDRPDAQGTVDVSAFDPQSVEMFRLIAKKAGRPAHFYPLAIATYDILPPPSKVESEVGEIRQARREGIYFSFGDEIDMERPLLEGMQDKHAQRVARATFIWNLVKSEYASLTALKKRNRQ